MDQQELKNVLELHRKWVTGESGGKRADLSSANLSSADLRSADLRSANLSSADLRSADLRYADLSYANLSYANLSYANLSSADLRYADLSYANLSYANLSYANLRSAKNEEIAADFFKVLSVAKAEVVGLYDSLIRGKIDGTVYEGECACLVGTIANLRHEDVKKLGIDLRPDAGRPSEKWFLGIAKGDTPANNPISALTVQWVEEFAKKEGIELPRYKLVSSSEFPQAFADPLSSIKPKRRVIYVNFYPNGATEAFKTLGMARAGRDGVEGVECRRFVEKERK